MRTSETTNNQTVSATTTPARRKPTGIDYYLMELEAAGVPFQQVVEEIDNLIRSMHQSPELKRQSETQHEQATSHRKH